MLVYFVLTPILIGLFLQVLPLIKTGRIIAVAAQCTLFVFAARLFWQSRAGEITVMLGGYESGLGIMLRADTLSSSFILLTAFIFLIASLYSFNEDDTRLLWFLFYVWQGLLVGVFLTCDLFNTFVLLEVVTLTVAVMIMFKRDTRSMYDGIFYLMINTVAMLFFLLGAGYLYKLTGTFDLSIVASKIAEIDKSSLILPFALIMTAICLKCGLVPLYSWLPRAHGTPGSPPAVSAVLSGLHVKTGIYLFIRMQTLFGDIFVSEFFLIIGIITGIAGFVLALSQTDIKLILAYHTVSQIGLIMIGLCAGNVYSYTGALYHIFSHALFKAALFLCAGIIVSTHGTREITKIKGVFREMPLVGITIAMAVLGITGAPFFNGSISKYFITSGADFLTEGAIIIVNLGTIISFLKFSSILPGKKEEIGVFPLTGRAPQIKPDNCSQAAALILGILCFLGGLFGESTISLLFGIELEIDIIGYIQKSVLFIASLIAGYIIYKYVLKRVSRLLKRLKEADLGFRALCALMGGFFAALLLVSGLV